MSRQSRPGAALRRSRAENIFWAVLFLLLGVVGVMVPVMPQIPFFIISLLFFSLAFPRVRRALRRFLHHHPKVVHAYKKWKDRRRTKRLELIRKEKGLAAKTE